ncbi:PIN domain-containing protein [Candidatus Poribacteria bacterium]|nr:PIN domain-containing protein [Candidatus Poribacteria bacterium]
MKLYLDNSFLNRPFDDPSIANNKLEAGALFVVIDWVKQGKAQLVNSAVIEYENSLNPFSDRKEFVDFVVKLAVQYQKFSPRITEKAHTIANQFRLEPMDALHIASAETAKVDFFVTSDYALFRKYKGEVNVITPLSALQKYDDSH